MGNLQLYSVVITRDADAKAKLAPAHFNQPMVTQAPVVLTICADFRRTTRWCEERNATPGYDNLLSFINAATDALLFTQTFSCLAEEYEHKQEVRDAWWKAANDLVNSFKESRKIDAYIASNNVDLKKLREEGSLMDKDELK